jgi:tetratricopeptide (TPR) repeat protein
MGDLELGKSEPPARTVSLREARDRRFRVPPPLTRSPGAFEGAELLEENSNETGVILWKSIRNVALWERVSTAERADLFPEGSAQQRLEELRVVALPGPLEQPLRVIAEVLDRPGETDPARLADACRAIADWALENSHLRTAVAYFQAAALLRPTDVDATVTVGRLARKVGEGQRAETWFHCAINQGRRVGDWRSYTRAYLGLGNLLAERGNLPAARRALSRAVRAASRRGYRDLQGMALHDLFTVAVAAGSMRNAERIAGQAADAYGPDHPRLPYLAHDIAFLWTEKGYFVEALRVFQRLQGRMSGFPEELILAANTARAAAGAGEHEVYEWARQDAEQKIPVTEFQEGVAAALVSLALAATSVGDWPRAMEVAERALRVTERTREGKMRLRAEGILDRARLERRRMPAEAGGRQSPPASTLQVAERLSELLSVEVT